MNMANFLVSGVVQLQYPLLVAWSDEQAVVTLMTLGVLYWEWCLPVQTHYCLLYVLEVAEADDSLMIDLHFDRCLLSIFGQSLKWSANNQETKICLLPLDSPSIMSVVVWRRKVPDKIVTNPHNSVTICVPFCRSQSCLGIAIIRQTNRFYPCLWPQFFCLQVQSVCFCKWNHDHKCFFV